VESSGTEEVNAQKQRTKCSAHGSKAIVVTYGHVLVVTRILFEMRDVTMLIVSSASWSFAGFVGENINLDISTELIYSVAQGERMQRANPRFSVLAVTLLEKHAAGLSFLVASAIGNAQTDSRDLD